jgi:hypothetical protein
MTLYHLTTNQPARAARPTAKLVLTSHDLESGKSREIENSPCTGSVKVVEKWGREIQESIDVIPLLTQG